MSINFPPNTVLAIVGPTGIGKTALTEIIADMTPVEIISADSRQIYRHMDIGTAKASPELQERIPHHFIDMLEPDQDYSAGEFGKDAREVAVDIFQRGKLPLVAGGSGLYVRAMLEGFFKVNVKDLEIRQQLQARLASEGIDPLFAELKKVDPELAEKNHPNNAKRVLRGLEVFYSAGRPLSEIQKEQPDPAPFQWIKIGLTMARQPLYDRINLRVEDMFQAGLLAEVQRILALGFSRELNALNSVGYKEVIAYLNKETDLAACKEKIKQHTRRYAKRQLTWFRADEEIRWIDVGGSYSITEIAGAILSGNTGHFDAFPEKGT